MCDDHILASRPTKDWIKFGGRGLAKGGRIGSAERIELKSSNSLTREGERGGGREGLHRRRPRQALYLRFNSRSGQINLQR